MASKEDIRRIMLEFSEIVVDRVQKLFIHNMDPKYIWTNLQDQMNDLVQTMHKQYDSIHASQTMLLYKFDVLDQLSNEFVQESQNSAKKEKVQNPKKKKSNLQNDNEKELDRIIDTIQDQNEKVQTKENITKFDTPTKDELVGDPNHKKIVKTIQGLIYHDPQIQSDQQNVAEKEFDMSCIKKQPIINENVDDTLVLKSTQNQFPEDDENEEMKSLIFNLEHQQFNKQEDNYVKTATGKKYHHRWCEYARNSKYPLIEVNYLEIKQSKICKVCASKQR